MRDCGVWSQRHSHSADSTEVSGDMLDHAVLDVLDRTCSEISILPLMTMVLDTSVIMVEGMASIS